MRHMLRHLLFSLLLILAGLPGLGIGAERGPSAQHACDSPCCRVERTRSCCEPAALPEYCPTSAGSCRCEAGSLPDRDQRPPTPLPDQSRSGQLTAVWGQPARISVGGQGVATGYGVPQAGPRGERSHNQRRALLGIWRT